MTFNGYHWRRTTHARAMRLWRRGLKGKAYQLFRDVIKDGRAEAAATRTN